MNCQVKTFVKMMGVVCSGLLLYGCAGSGEILNLDLRALPSAAGSLSQDKDTKTTKVFVQALEDKRHESKGLGTRTHFWGGQTYFNVQGGDAGATVARIIADYLRQEGVTVGVGTPGVTKVEGEIDVILSGHVLEFSARAKSRFGSTTMTTVLKLTLRAKNTTDNSSTGMTLDDTREETVFWYNDEDLEHLANVMLQGSIRKLLQDMTFENKKVRLG